MPRRCVHSIFIVKRFTVFYNGSGCGVVSFQRVCAYITGKSTMLATLGCRDVPIPDHIDSFHLKEEAPPLKDVTPLEFVLNVDDERSRLEKEIEALMQTDRKFV